MANGKKVFLIIVIVLAVLSIVACGFCGLSGSESDDSSIPEKETVTETPTPIPTPEKEIVTETPTPTPTPEKEIVTETPTPTPTPEKETVVYYVNSNSGKVHKESCSYIKDKSNYFPVTDISGYEKCSRCF